MAGRGTSPTVVGRRTEFEVLAGTVASVQAGQPRIVLVAGDAGIGKTRLVTEACARAEQHGVLTAVGGCVQLGTSSLAYAPLIQALREVRRRFGDGEFTELLGPAAATVGVLLGITEVGSDRRRELLFEQLLAVLGRLADRQPTLLVFEDLHWADASTRDLIAFLARNLRNVSIGLVLTYRGDELHRRHPWLPVLADLHRDPQVERITLTGLGRTDLAALLAQISADNVLVDELLRRTDGNPLYVEELVAAAGLSERVPATLAEVILARLHDLPEPTPAVLHQAAVFGEAIDEHWLAQLTERPLPEITEALREAVSRHLLIADGVGCRFRHALVREALYDDLLPGERERLHAAAARLLQHKQPHIPEHVRQTLLAYHAHAAADVPTAFAASVHAGAACEQVYAMADAAAQYERALGLWDQVTDPEAAGMTRPQLCISAAECLAYASQSSRAVGLADEAFTALPADASPEQRAELLVRIAGINRMLHTGDAWLRICERAVAVVADRPPSRAQGLALAMLGGALMLRERAREAEPLLRQAITVAKQVDAPAVTAQALDHLGAVLGVFGRAEQALAAHREALQLRLNHDTAVGVCISYVNLSHELYGCGHYDEAAQVAVEGIAYATRTGLDKTSAVFLAGNRITALFCAGRWSEAEQVWAQFSPRTPEPVGWLHGQWLYVLLGQGRLQEAREIIDALLEPTADTAEVQFAAETLLLAGQLADLEQRWDDAREFFRRGLELTEASDDQYYSSRGYASAIRAERRRLESLAGQRAAAEQVQRARQVADQRVRQARDLASRLAAAGIGLLPEPAAWLRTTEAEHAAIYLRDTPQTFADLADTWHTVGQPFPVAVAQYRHADALLRQHGDRDHARRAAAAALQVAERLGAAPLANEIRQLAQRGRLDLSPTPQPQPETATDRLDITPRETEVLTLLATGRTNREIARMLYISDKTASVHVSSLLRKLGVGTRVEAAAIAQRLGLADNEPRTSGQPAAKT